MPVAPSACVHPTAVIDPEADLDEGVKVGPHVVIEGPVKIGANTVIRPSAYLIGPMTIGKNNDIGKGVVIGERPQHLLYKGEPTWTIIGDGNIFREFVTIHRGHGPDGVTTIGNNNFLMANSHVGHDAKLGNNVIMANSSLIGGHGEVHDRGMLSGLSGVHQFSRVGKVALISGLSCATKDVLPYTVVVGRNGVFGLNQIGMRRAGIPLEKMLVVREAYKILYRSNLLQRLAVDKLERELGHIDIVAEMLEFIRASKRGFLSAYHFDHEVTSHAA